MGAIPCLASLIPRHNCSRRLLQQAALGPEIEVDDWLIGFANLFRDMTGVDPDRHVDMHNLGWEQTTAAMEATLQVRCLPSRWLLEAYLLLLAAWGMRNERLTG